MDHRRLGIEAEEAARKYLIDQGMQLIHENYRCRTGELDIVGILKGVLVVVEVRMRSKSRFGDAAASISRLKRGRIIRATNYLLIRRPELKRYPVRFDVVALDSEAPSDNTRIVWHRAAFDARG